MNRNAFRVPTTQPGSRMPQYNPQQLPATPGADVSARLSDSAGQIMTQGVDQQAKGLEMLGRGMQQAAKAGYDLYNDYQTTKAKEAWLTYKQEATTKRAELGRMQGKDAIDPDKGIEAQMAAWRTERRQTLMKDLGGPAASMFDTAAKDIDSSMDAWAIDKINTERLNYENKTSEAHISLLQDEAMTLAANPALFGQKMGALEGELKAIAGRSGLDETWVKAKFQDIQQKTLTQTISDSIAGEQLGKANAMIEAYGPMLGGAAEGLRARAAAKGRELQARARAEAERAEGEAAISVVSGLLNDTVGLTRQERESAVLARIAEEPDLKKRHRMASLAKSELAFEELRETAQTEKQIVDFYDETKGMTPIQQMQHLETSTNISAAARDKLRPKLSTEWHRETPQNQAALSDVMLDIDKAKAAGLPNSDIEQRVYARAAVRGLTPEQTKKAVKYAQEGGSTGSLKFSEANSIWKRLTGKKEMPAEAFETLRSQLPQGREATAADIERVLANFYMSGKSADSGWFSDSENYLESLKHGRGEAWLPNVTDQEKKDISKLLQRAGVAVSLEKIRKYKKHVIMGIPEEIGGSK